MFGEIIMVIIILLDSLLWILEEVAIITIITLTGQAILLGETMVPNGEIITTIASMEEIETTMESRLLKISI